MLAERLVSDRGLDVEVLTTCALDAITWRDELPEGTVEVNGVTVQPHPLGGGPRRELPPAVGPDAGRSGAGQP